MFSKQTYIGRRDELKKLVGDGVILLFGNNESPCNYPNNAYYPFRQDSTFLYYFGQQRDGLVGVIDIDNNKEILVGDDIDIEDIVWYGSVDSVADMAAQVGVANSAPMSQLQVICDEAKPRAAASISCRLTVTTPRSRSWTCWAFIPTSRPMRYLTTCAWRSSTCVRSRRPRRS